MKNLSLHPSNSPMLSEMLFAFLPRASNTSYKWPLCSILDIAILHMFFTNGYHIGMINKWLVYIHETWSQSCHSFHSVKAFALPCQSKRATPKAPRLCTYIESSLDNER